MRAMEQNQNVCLLIADTCSKKSVIIYGTKIIMNDCDCDDIVTIKIQVKEITGRKFC